MKLNLWIVVLLIISSSLQLFAQTSTSIRIESKSTTGSQLRKSHIAFIPLGFESKEPTYSEIQPTKLYETQVSNGWYKVICTGLDHKPLISPQYFYCGGEPMTISVELEPNAIKSSIDSVTIVSTLGMLSFAKQAKMKKIRSNTYLYEETVADPSIKEVGYQVILYTKNTNSDGEIRSINGTTMKRSQPDASGDYVSYVPVENKKFRVIFSTEKFPVSSKQGSMTIKESTPKEIMDVASEVLTMEDKIRLYAMAKARNSAPKVNLDSLRLYLVAQIAKPKHPLITELRLVGYLNAASFLPDTLWNNSTMQSLIMNAVPASSPAWELFPELPTRYAKRFPQFKEYVSNIESDHPSMILQSEVLLGNIEAATESDSTTARKLYSKLLTQYPKTRAAKTAVQLFNPDRKIKVGSQIPDFSFESIDANNPVFTPAALKGKWVLIDNWATWCGPCVGEMPVLQECYEAFSSKNFTILSVSFDKSPDDVTKFRTNRWKMPWLHAFSKGVFKNEATKIFEVQGIPKPILIDPSGKIVALEGELRGRNLLKTLEKYVK